MDGGTGLAALLRGWRGRALLTQEQLAERTGLGVRTIRRMETSAQRRPHSSSVRLLADALGLSEEERALLAAACAQPARTHADVPHQLPADVAGFSGRRRQLARLDARLAGLPARDGGPPAVMISAIAGTAGVGKTALAVHWAHRVADQFPDGQLYANLRGFDPTGSPVRPADALRAFLDALAVPAERIPVGVDAQAALYRSLLAGRRMLVLLDNARDTAQVRPLLPGSPGCLVVVTSRDQMSGLVAAEGADLLILDLLPSGEARQLLARRLGAARVATEPHAVADIIAGCARLPLALALVAARAAAHPGFRLATYADELRDAQAGLDALHAGDAATDVRAIFSWSYRTLSAPAARLFRLLSLHPGQDIGVAAAVSLAGLAPAEVRQMLAELTRAHLLTEHAAGRFGFHDLLRAYAAELAQATDDPAERRAATHRVLDHYLHTAEAAAVLFYPKREPIVADPPAPGVVPEPLRGFEQAKTWFETEHATVLAAIGRAAHAGFDGHVWRLAWTLDNFLDQQGRWRDEAACQLAALEAARRLSDRAAQAHAHRGLGRAQSRLGRYADACDHLKTAAELFGELGEHARQAHTHVDLAHVMDQQGKPGEALEHSERALALYRSVGHRAGVARALNAVGWCHTELGNYRQAVVHCEQALDLNEELGHRHGAASTWDSLGLVHHRLGDYDRAAACYGRAIDIFRQLGDRFGEADTLAHLGDTNAGAGETGAARQTWRAALDILDELDHPSAGEVRRKLDRPRGRAGSPR